MEALQHTYFTEQNSSAAMLDRQVTELTNHREACSIWAGLPVIGQEIQWVDQWSSRGVGQGTRAHKTAGNRAYSLMQSWGVRFTSSSSPPAACKKCARNIVNCSTLFHGLGYCESQQSVKRLRWTYSCRRYLSFFEHSNTFPETRRQNGQNVFT